MYFTSGFISFLTRRFLFPRDRQNRRSAVIFISTAGIFFASCAVLVALGILSGYQGVYHKAVLNFSAHLIVLCDEGLSSSSQAELSRFLDHTGIKNKYSFYHFYEALMPGKKGFEPVIFKGLDPDKMRAVYPVQYKLINRDASNQVYIGSAVLQNQPGIMRGEKFKFLIMNNDQEKTGFKRIAVDGSFESGYYDFDSRFIFVPLKMLHEIFLRPPLVSGVEIRLEDLGHMHQLKQEIIQKFPDQFDILTWDELNDSLFKALKLERTVVFSVSFLILMIACLNIFGFNFLFFIERRREFLVLSALGAGLATLRRLLTSMSLFLGGLAAVSGAALGFVILVVLSHGRGLKLDPSVYFVDRVPVHYNYIWFVFFVAGAVALCYITSFLAGRVVLKRYMTGSLL
ncbi:MAG: ABC transporter permease [Deltaproteobacteria bacterium]|nr:ABC transporter permease [Deltaproteobacteria bacterium]